MQKRETILALKNKELKSSSKEGLDKGMELSKYEYTFEAERDRWAIDHCC